MSATFPERDLQQKDLLQDFDNGGEKKIANYEIVESDFLTASDIKNVDGVKIEILTEAQDVKTDWGMKPQCEVKVFVGNETHKKTTSFNKPMINHLVRTYGKSSKDRIGKTVEVTTKFIKGNDAIVPKEIN